MKNKISILIAGILMLAAMLLPNLAVADDELKNFLKNDLQKEMENRVNKLIAYFDQNYVGIGAVVYISTGRLNENPITVAIVERVLPKSPAEYAGLRPGAIIFEVNGKLIASGDEFVKEVLGNGKPGNAVRLMLLANIPVEVKTALFAIKHQDRKKAAELKNSA